MHFKKTSSPYLSFPVFSHLTVCLSILFTTLIPFTLPSFLQPFPPSLPVITTISLLVLTLASPLHPFPSLTHLLLRPHPILKATLNPYLVALSLSSTGRQDNTVEKWRR